MKGFERVFIFNRSFIIRYFIFKGFKVKAHSMRLITFTFLTESTMKQVKLKARIQIN